jgi:hypothetical protein
MGREAAMGMDPAWGRTTPIGAVVGWLCPTWAGTSGAIVQRSARYVIIP